MDFDSFFSSSRWKILEVLSKKPSSPLEISQQLNTSVAYVSQQLKLLQAANLVITEKTGSVEKGKPRTVFSLSGELLYLTALLKKSPFKKIIYLTDHHKLTLRIWMLDDSDLHYYIEKLYWMLEDEIKDVDGLLIDNSLKKPLVIVISDSKKLKPKINYFQKIADKKADCIILSKSELKKISSRNIHAIYDPNSLLLGREVKGGEI